MKFLWEIIMINMYIQVDMKRSWTFKNRKRKQLTNSVHFCSVEWKDDQKDKLYSWMFVYTSICSDVLIKMTMKPWVKRRPDKFGDNRTSLFWIFCFFINYNDMNYWIGLSYEVLSSTDYRFYSIENGIKILFRNCSYKTLYLNSLYNIK